jgi:hypothetical protein
MRELCVAPVVTGTVQQNLHIKKSLLNKNVFFLILEEIEKKKLKEIK